MEESVTCSLCSVYEHDMDVLLMQAMLSDPEFLSLFIDKTDWRSTKLKAIHGELSNMDVNLGETDITIILTDGSKKYALLMEDKIDANAQPKQHKRYVERGKKAVNKGEISDFRVFIVCPEKYHAADKEAQKYEHYVSYEECAAYFQNSNGNMNRIRYQEIMQAIDKAKKPPQITIIEDANIFFHKYREYQRENFPHLKIQTKKINNGYWPKYWTCLPNGKAVLHHKMNKGKVDLTFTGRQDKHATLDAICAWFNQNGLTDIYTDITDKSVILRIYVPEMTYHDGFDNIPKENLNKCFVAISKMVEIAKLLHNVYDFLNEQEPLSTTANAKRS